MQVSIQSGYEEQGFWDGHSTSFEALQTETPSLERKARLVDEPPGLSDVLHSPGTEQPLILHTPWGRAQKFLLVPSEAQLGGRVIHFLAPMCYICFFLQLRLHRTPTELHLLTAVRRCCVL